jgi:hypothetical protein
MYNRWWPVGRKEQYLRMRRCFSLTSITHPKAFAPSPQNITAATSATGSGSKLQYTIEGFTTVPGVTGTASSGN